MNFLDASDVNSSLASPDEPSAYILRAALKLMNDTIDNNERI